MNDKERLRLAKEALGSGSYDKETIEYIFPELKESEDERIKKDIISYIQLANQFIPQFQKDKWIAWLEKQGNNINCIYDKELSELLHIVICRYVNDPDISYIERENVSKKIFPYVELLEKQGEHANFLSKIQIGDKVTRNEDGVLVNLSQLKRVAKPAEKQGELIGDTDTVDSNEDGLIAETMKYKREQKSAWSEEDEKMFNKIAVHLNATCSGFSEDEKWANEFLNWFKILKERVQFQPKQEWSKEDINMLQSILDEYKSMPIEKRNWLKSLKQRIGG